MILTRNQIEELLNIIEFHFLHTMTISFGADVLNEQERALLESFGVDLAPYLTDNVPYNKMYLLGKLTSILSQNDAMRLSYNDFLYHVKHGQYFPLTKREKFELEIAKRKTYTHLKGLKNNAKEQFENILLEDERITREQYETAVKEEINESVLKRKSTQSVVSSLGNRLGVWGHDWNRIVDTEMNNIFQKGRAEELKEKHGDPLVYKDVYEGACRHCIKAYLTNGLGSKPKIFKLSELEANGTNIGRKVADWKPVLGGMHPFCRCTLNYVPDGYTWNEEKKMFEIPDDFKRKVNRKSNVYVHVGKKKFVV